MLDLLNIAKPFADMDTPVDAETERAVCRWLYAEARFLDAERYQDWLEGFIDPEIHYWMPDMETRRRDDPRGTFSYGEAAYFDDNLPELTIRVKRYNEPSAWADNPATRHAHLISNIEVNATDDPSLLAVCSAFTNVRNRNEADQDIIHGRREDVLRKVEGGFRLLRRRVFIVQNVLLSKNLNTFF
ncbi:3-phenylpropionate/cinnamic acid dioxygenase subunit beta [Salipiger sp. P9]|uniref:3-phenylpropionate/cinnamic acid dioxygenase subunit beta n=1 Tax=Salipiger pentaromativorans TaxID=2943193 RepID=UPI002158528B|nr:3-phenylpropionate/cinnamic acid dioxygenase subunit beta [Salipiger pentaromativorans]MCR8548857.1 3-phenylpropionate/cinnamic acid dioxygenase subunit beta [Salipiger pentaromativorans]